MQNRYQFPLPSRNRSLYVLNRLHHSLVPVHCDNPPRLALDYESSVGFPVDSNELLVKHAYKGIIKHVENPVLPYVWDCAEILEIILKSSDPLFNVAVYKRQSKSFQLPAHIKKLLITQILVRMRTLDNIVCLLQFNLS